MIVMVRIVHFFFGNEGVIRNDARNHHNHQWVSTMISWRISSSISAIDQGMLIVDIFSESCCSTLARRTTYKGTWRKLKNVTQWRIGERHRIFLHCNISLLLSLSMESSQANALILDVRLDNQINLIKSAGFYKWKWLGCMSIFLPRDKTQYRWQNIVHN